MVHAATAPSRTIRRAGRSLAPEIHNVLGDLHGKVDGDVLALAFDSDGNALSIEDGGILRRWEPKTGNLLQTCILSEIETCWAFSHDGRFLASGSHGLGIWETEEGNLLGRHDDPSWMTSLCFSPDSRLIATGHDDFKVRLWNSQTGKLVHVLAGHSDEISAIAFSENGELLATAAEDRLVQIWNVRSGDSVARLEGHTDRVDDLAWSPSGHRLASAGWDTSVRVWDPKKAELLAMLNGQGECVHSVRFTPDGKWIVCVDSDGFLRVWDYGKLKVKGEIRVHSAAARRIAIHPSGKWAVTGGTDRVLRFCEIPSAEALVDVHGARTTVVSLAAGAKDDVAVVHGEGTLTTWNTQTGREESTGSFNEPVLCVDRNSRGEFAVGTMSGKIAVTKSIDQPSVIEWQADSAAVRLIAFRPDGKEIASSATVDGTVRVWDAATGEPTLIIPEAVGKGTVESIAYHPSQPILAAAGMRWGSGADGAIKIWDTQRIALVRSFFTGATAITFSPDGKFLAAATLENAILIWNVHNGKVVFDVAGSEASVNALAFDPSGDLFVIGGDDNTLRVWDTSRWRMRSSIDIDTKIRCLKFSPDGNQLITGNGNSTCYVIGIDDLS